MPAILCLMFLMFLSGSGLAQKRARTLLPQLKLTGMEKELAGAAVLDGRALADAMIGLAERSSGNSKSQGASTEESTTSSLYTRPWPTLRITPKRRAAWTTQRRGERTWPSE